MAFTAKDGSRFTNHSAFKSHEARTGGKAPQKAPAAALPDAMDGMDDDQEDPQAVAMQHGPAMEVNVTHDHAAGVHHVHSVHPDGHETHTDHDSVEAAHEHGQELATPDEAMPGDEEEQ